VPLIAISTDKPEESAKFATDYGIRFPLLYDEDAKVARDYTGVSYDDTAIPGVVITRADGTIAFRQIAETKDDRLSAAQVLAEVDRTLGTHGDGVAGGYQALARTQLRVEAGGGTSLHAAASVLWPLARYVVVGPWLETDRGNLGVDAALGLRLPLLADTAAIEAFAIGGSTLWRDYNYGGEVGLWVAWTPRFGFHLDGGVRWTRDDAGTSHSWFVTAGVSWLLEPAAHPAAGGR